MPMCDLSELSGMHTLASTLTLPSKVPLKTHRANSNLNVIEVENISSPRRANDMSLGECQAVYLASSSPYSPNVLTITQKPLNLSSNNSASDPLLSTSALPSMTSNMHRVNDSNVADEVTQRCANNVSPGECQTANTGVHSSSSFYLSPTLNLSSSSSSSSDSGVSVIFLLLFF